MRKHAKYTYQSQFLEMFGNPQTCSSGVVGKDVFEFASGKALTKENLNPEYEYNCYGGNGVTGKSNDYLVEASTIVIGRVGEYCGGIHLTNPYSWITDNAIYLKKYDSRYELEFIEYLFKAMDFHRFASESGQPKITQSPLIESVYPLPSKDEQIAFLIIKRQADKSKFDGFKSQFLEMFGNPQTCNIGVVGKEVFGFASGKAQIRENLNPAYNYNCYGGNGVTGKSKEFLVKESTIVIGRVGEYCGCIHLTTPYSWITDNAIYLKKCDSRYLLEFLEYLFKAMDFHRFASESGQPKITQAPLIESVYPLPTIEEQTNFLIIKRQADKSKFELRKAISAIDEVIKSLING